MSDGEFRATLFHVAPILATLLMSVTCAFLIQESRIPLTPATLLPETGYGPLLNAALFVFASGFGATMIYFLLKLGVHRFIRLLIAFAFSVLTFFLVILYAELVFAVIGVESSSAVTLSLAFLATGFVLAQIIMRRGRFYEVVILAFGGATGALLGASIPIISAVLILALLAVYDVYAVFRGPVGKIASTELEQLRGISVPFRGVHVGLGDLIFYSMLASRVLLSFGWGACIAAVIGVLLGSFLSFKMVEKKGMFPGLPFSVFLGLLAASTMLVLAQTG